MTTYKSVKYNISGADLTGLTAGQIPNLDTAKITTGELANARVADLPASKITSGTFADARISASSVQAHASSYIAWQSVVTASTLTAVAGRGYPINTTSNACTVTLPASASVGDTIKFVDYARNWGTNALTLNQNSLKFQGETSPNPIYNTNGQAVTLTYVDATKGWIPTVDDAVPNEVPQNIEYLVIAGGGSGGGGHRAGAGGAGGYRNSYASETSGRNSATETPYIHVGAGTVITVTVGAGGAMPSANDTAGNTGSVSTISGSGFTTITSNAGGGGGNYGTDAPSGTYGSGAGSGHGLSNTGGGSTGTAGQGFDGGDVASGGTQQGGAGGGAGANGADGGTSSPTAGGVGLSSSITGSGVFRAGGGGAGTYGSGGYSSGGNGGGGNGGSDDASDPHSGVANSNGGSFFYPVSGTVNTGGGGGGQAANGSNGQSYGSGGSGVVILRMTDSVYSGTTTGSPTIDTSTVADETILIFNASGSYTT